MKSVFFLWMCTATFQFVHAQSEIPGDWKLTDDQAAKMMTYFKRCTGNCFTSKARPDTAKEAAIRAAYPNAKSFSWQNARYTAADMVRYASRNARGLKSGGDQVAGYTTQILKVVDEDGSVYYFDIASICPPPSLCDVEEQLKSGDQ